jgi:pantetheine-phosphate adenylyltransferase
MNKQNQEKIALFPGSFDPVTLGHLDLMRRSAQLFDRVIVGILINTSKNYFLDIEERKKLIQLTTAKIPNITVATFPDQLTVEVAKSVQAKFLIRGLRNIKDYEYEQEVSFFNEILSKKKLETVFLLANPCYCHLNSQMIKEIFHFGGDLSSFLPPEVDSFLRQKQNLNEKKSEN